MMESKYKNVFMMVVMVILSLTGCSEQKIESKQLFVSIAPYQFIINEISGDNFDVDIMVPPGQSPATYSPTPQQMVRLEKSTLFFSVSVPFEKRLLAKIRNDIPNLEIVDLQENIDLIEIGGHHEEANHNHDHDHGAYDPHSWLDPQRFKAQAFTIKNKLIELHEVSAAQYEAGHAQLADRLDSLDLELAEILKDSRFKGFVVFHPTFGYFADRYGLYQYAIEEDGKEPTGRQLAELISRSKETGIRAVIIQPQFSQKSAKIVADAIGAEIVEIDQLPTDFESYQANLIKLAKTIAGNQSDEN